MKILFLHRWRSVAVGVKPTYLKDAGHAVVNSAVDDDDLDTDVRTAQAALDQHRPDVIAGAVAMNIESGDTPLVLLCPAWKRWGTARSQAEHDYPAQPGRRRSSFRRQRGTRQKQRVAP